MFEIDIDNNGCVICTGTDYINPFSRLRDVRDELIKRNIVGEILFDLYNTNGQTSNRFVKIEFDGQSFKRETFTIVNAEILDKHILDKQNQKFNIY